MMITAVSDDIRIASNFYFSERVLRVRCIVFLHQLASLSSYSTSLGALYSISLYRNHRQTKQLTIKTALFFGRSQNCKSTVHSNISAHFINKL